jgi:hypothetical protein
MLCPGNQFLLACDQSMQPWLPSNPRWLVDCAYLIRNADIDWNRVIDQAGKLQMRLHVRTTLTYLRKHFEDTIPPGVIASLAALPVSLAERIQYFLAGRPAARQDDLVHKCGAAACRYLAMEHGAARQFICDLPRLVRTLTRLMNRHKEQPG